MTVTNELSSQPKALQSLDHRLCVAPMMDWTDRHCRVFHRLLAPRARLYTEMVPAGAILFGDRTRFLRFDPSEHPLALQLGGADPDQLAEAAAIAETFGFDEINLNVGCPSDRVQNGRFGACLMREPDLVAACIAAMRAATRLPVTVKTRIGVDHDHGLAPLLRFVEPVAARGCRTFVVHARNAWLQGLSPKQNREIPPLRHDLVHQLKEHRPDLEIVLNGGLADPHDAIRHLDRSADERAEVARSAVAHQERAQVAQSAVAHQETAQVARSAVAHQETAQVAQSAVAHQETAQVARSAVAQETSAQVAQGAVAQGKNQRGASPLDGLMLGRSAYQDPWCLTAFHHLLFPDVDTVAGRDDAVYRLLPYLERECTAGTPLKAITRHLLGLFNGLPGARRWRRHLSEAAHRPAAGPEVVLQAMAFVTAHADRHAA